MANSNWGGVVLGIIAGAAIGAGIGMLYAPQSGRKTRRDLQKQAGELKKKAEHFSDVVKERAEEFGTTVTDNADKYRHKVMSNIN
ncbi:hypothetical protein DGWBC_0443 [Dehalogenimonas sp. WBC-2]|nr:hypothetical protein DGWBC_0443 [Dehalogenimonas sp. WBC-2]